MISQMIGREPVKIVCKRTPRNNWAVQRAVGDYDVCFTIYHAPISVHLNGNNEKAIVNQIFTAALFNVRPSVGGLFILMMTILRDLQINTFSLRMQIEFLKLCKVALIRRS